MSNTHTSTKTVECRVSFDYVKTIPGILKIVELVLSIIAFACAASVADLNWSPRFARIGHGYGWVSFVAISGFLKALVSLILHIFMDSNWTFSHLLELILYAIWTVLFLISGIVAAALAYGYSTNVAATVFTFFCLIAWAIDTALQGKNVRFTSGPPTTTTTTTAPSSYPDNPTRFDGNPQY